MGSNYLGLLTITGTVVCIILVFRVDYITSQPPHLNLSHYHSSCPTVEAIIHRIVATSIKTDPTLAPALIRLHFHDCAVRGCDASVLLNHTGSERIAQVSRRLKGFQIIDEIKAQLETTCHRTVSCADILTAAVRDATVLAGGPFWEVPFGLKDGRISISSEADRLVPQGHENITTLIQLFTDKLGLNLLDLAVLSGSHTIGHSSCNVIQNRLVNPNPEPSLNTTYLNILKRECGGGINISKNTNNQSSTVLVDLDATTPTTFNTFYYKNLENKMGLLSTDQLLYSDTRTSPFVEALINQPSLFFSQFAASMVKLGNVGVLTRPNEGEIRSTCSHVNPCS